MLKSIYIKFHYFFTFYGFIVSIFSGEILEGMSSNFGVLRCRSAEDGVDGSTYILQTAQHGILLGTMRARLLCVCAEIGVQVDLRVCEG